MLPMLSLHMVSFRAAGGPATNHSKDRQLTFHRRLPQILWLQNAGYNTYYTGKLFNAHTVENYHSPFPAGWTGSDFLLDPFTYSYLNSSYQRNRDPPVSHEGEYSVDVLKEKTYGFLDDAVNSGKPFFLGVAPVAPHGNIVADLSTLDDAWTASGAPKVHFSAPVAAERHNDLFRDAKVPRTENFNPEEPSGANWIRTLSIQTQERVDYNDHFYRQRLRALQSVDELVDGIVSRLEGYGILENTFIIYTSDNGYHIGQHRLPPGKECGYEEDVNVPLIVRGPGVPQDLVAEAVTTHTDLAPTILDIAGITRPRDVTFDGEKIPLTKDDIEQTANFRHEHVNIEYWGFALAEGRQFPGSEFYWTNNTYKALRVASDTWNLYYSVWCNDEHELYDLKTDPGQLRNLLSAEKSHQPHNRLQGIPMEKVAVRLDSLLFVLKSCEGETCLRPWKALHPAGNVNRLDDALSSRFDRFYQQEQKRIKFDHCENGYIRSAEGPQFEDDGLLYRGGAKWSEWV
ncbi:hypothetical protein DL764_001771 [Monosporascus ibericus]|uniref:Sulfatase N-terminal domain-containing protein n=1 Tax=Monosporascus ibericus TaxID=155417 RepID=A0A4Q4TT38_9PEZI|nr:hypothetical protein DL764_001771 [Monosporascus ibericus]